MRKAVICFFLFLVTLYSFSQENVVFPNIYSFEKVEVLYKKEPRPIVVFLYTDWCKFCYLMKKNTFSDKKIIQQLNDRFYFIPFNAEQKETVVFFNKEYKYKPTGKNTGMHELAQILGNKNGKVSYPTTVFLSTDFSIEEQYNTFLSKKDMLKILVK